MIQAIKQILEADVQGCFYHLGQSTWWKIQEMGLAVHYRESEVIRALCGSLDGLALLPLDKVEEGMQHLRDICPCEASEFLDYFDTTYVTGKYKPSTQDDLTVRLRRVPPRFPSVAWSAHQAIIDNDPRTNNHCEAWNFKFKNLVGHSHPSVWRLIRSLQQDSALVSTQISQSLLGNPPQKRTKQVFINLQKRLQNLCVEIREKRMDIPEFLTSVGHLIKLN